MILRKVRVQNFKSVEDSTMFDISDITCLVGKNESGKTAILQALYKLNPVVAADGKFLDTEYPRRRWSEYKERKANKPDPVLTTSWEILPVEVKALEAILGTKALNSKLITITKGYNNETNVEFDVNYAEVVKFHLDTAAPVLQQEELDEYGKFTSTQDLIKALKEKGNPSDRETALLAKLTKSFPKGSARGTIDTLAISWLPKFVYFADYYKLQGQVSIDALLATPAESRKPSDQIFLSLLGLAGTTPEQIRDIQQFEPFISELEAVQNRISQTIFKYWSQNRHLRVNFRFDPGKPQDPAPFNAGWVFRTRIENTRHGVSVSFDERSTGFVWFFSFLVWFSRLQHLYGKNLFPLLDEPGLTLHARAQADLLRYLREQLRPVCQVMYTTHSPFMIDGEALTGARTVEDVVGPGDELLGTKVSDKIFSTDADTVFPLQAALSYDISQTLFVGKHNVLIEGPSDLLFLQWASRQLVLRGKKGLDRRWTLSPAGGIDKIASFVALFGGKKLHNAVFTDYHSGDKTKIRNLRETKLLQDGHVFTADMYANQAEADAEDLLGRELYVAVVNMAFGLDGKNGKTPLPTAKPAVSSVRVVKEAEDHFGTLPPDAPLFDHYLPSEFLFEGGADLAMKLPGVEAALDRFEKLFADLNKLLPPN